LVVCTIGGTSVGKELLSLCGQAFPLLKASIPDLRMLLVCGPRLKADALEVPEGLEIRGYVPDLYEHFAACDLAIVQGGGTTTLELTALKRPFIYFPIEGHFEQAQVAQRLERHRAGIRMSLSQTSPEGLAEQALSALGEEAPFTTIPVDGGRRAAELIAELI
jgi:UDP-N-acetylglucosamine:LPS N-acetylglucosamine transferase